jgi:hypothetical protein
MMGVCAAATPGAVSKTPWPAPGEIPGLVPVRRPRAGSTQIPFPGGVGARSGEARLLRASPTTGRCAARRRKRRRRGAPRGATHSGQRNACTQTLVAPLGVPSPSPFGGCRTNSSRKHAHAGAGAAMPAEERTCLTVYCCPPSRRLRLRSGSSG